MGQIEAGNPLCYLQGHRKQDVWVRSHFGTSSSQINFPKCIITNKGTEKVSSLGKDWHKLCLKCDRCNKLLNAGGHAEHDGRPYCHKPCYAALFGPKGELHVSFHTR
uniref:LIM zinc-binding domain-containing protein n=1 Tax=Periophthalmus magnuspinnatus TaxID=409849 RepID=A0A3B4A1V9_9GOBI